jgi:biotin carboxyl carrier protein
MHWPTGKQMPHPDYLQPVARSEFAIRLVGEVLSHPRLAEAATAFATALAQYFAFDRVSVGVVDAGSCRVVARSHALAPDASSAASDAVAAAMAEAVEQGTSLVLPAAGSESTAASTKWLTQAHQSLLRGSSGMAATIPLAVGGRPVAAVTLQSFGPRMLAAEELCLLENLSGLLAPALDLMRQNERPWRRRLIEAYGGWRTRLRTEEGRGSRRVLAAAAAVALFLVLAPVERRVGAEARVEGEVQRVLAAPSDGFLKAAHARAGDMVRAGQPLAELVDQDLMLERERWASQLRQHESAYATAMARTDRAQAAIALSRAAEAQAQLSLAESELGRAQILAPFDGVVIHGDLSQSLGAPVTQGQALFTIAPADRYRVIIEVDERDVSRIGPGQPGTLALSALPWDTLPIEVVRLTPMATPVEGRNVFEIEARLLGTRDGLRPGLRGHARVTVGRQPLAWTWATRLGGSVRLALWGWLA